MTTPRLEIFLENGALCIAKVDNENEGTRLIVDIEMDELKSLTPAEATHRVGGTVLNILRLWHGEAFGAWQVPAIFTPPASS
jgi:hypothetical protein